MKKLLFTALLAATTLGFSQSNEQGTIHVNVLGGFMIGGATDKVDGDSYKSTVGSANFGVKGQYGLADNISAGLTVKYGSYVLVPKDIADSDGTNDTMTALNIGVEGRFYIVNGDSFNFFAGPTVGFTSANNKFAGVSDGSELKLSGLNYGANLGINWYFNDVIGGTVQAAYEGSALSGDYKITGEDDEAVKRNFGGVNIMAGLAFKF